MNKTKIALFIGLTLISSHLTLMAATDVSKQKSMSSSAPVSFSEQEFMKSVQDEIKNGTNEDILLEMLLMTPYEKRQYFFPFIHEEPFLSHKLKSHPDILFWKNKKPTRIAPQLEAFSKQYLNELPSTLYPFLDPDFWTPVSLEKQPNLYGIDLNTTPLPPFRESNYQYPSLETIFKLSPQTIANYQKTDLTATDVTHLTNILTHFNDYAKKLKNPEETKRYLRVLNTQFIRAALADPFNVFEEHIIKIGEKESFDSFVKENGFKSIADFTNKADRLLKAYRAQQLNPLLAIQFNHIRADMPTDKKTMTSTQMYARMYEAKPGDIYFVMQQKDNLKSSFPTNELIYWGIPIYID